MFRKSPTFDCELEPDRLHFKISKTQAELSQELFDAFTFLVTNAPFIISDLVIYKL